MVLGKYRLIGKYSWGLATEIGCFLSVLKNILTFDLRFLKCESSLLLSLIKRKDQLGLIGHRKCVTTFFVFL